MTRASEVQKLSVESTFPERAAASHALSATRMAARSASRSGRAVHALARRARKTKGPRITTLRESSTGCAT
jgi:hypothetical protein